MSLIARAEVSDYVDTPLSQPRALRVAILLPGKAEAALQVLIREHDLDDKSLEYEAMSYCWGGVDRNYQVLCRGK